jgi:argininosuccinate lyase
VDFIYIAALGRLNSMPVNAMEYRSMPKGSTLAQITAETRRFEQDIRKDYATLVRMLISAGVLTAAEAAQLPNPQVNVVVRL